MGSLTNTVGTLSSTAATKTELNAAVSDKATKAELANYATTSSVTTGLASKVNQSDYDKKIGEINNSIALAATKAEVAGVKTEALATIDEKIRVVNALVYKGTINAKASLPTSKVSIGDLYVAGEVITFDSETNKVAQPGDLIIAQCTEGTDGYITSGSLNWHIVACGYNETFEPSLATTYTDTKNQIEVALNSYTDVSLGSFVLKTEGDNLAISKSTVDEKTVYSIKQVWGTF
jgi:hypothetical protein